MDRCLSIFTPALLFLLSVILVPCLPAIAQSAESGGPAQWRSVGGELIFSTKHDFDTVWTAAGNRMWWKNDEDRALPPRHSSDEVNKDIEVKKGQITVRGPGFLCLFTRRKGNASVILKDPETGNMRAWFDLGAAGMYMKDGELRFTPIFVPVA